MDALAPTPAPPASTKCVFSGRLPKTSFYCSLGWSTFRCKSWRCRRCRTRRLAQDYARMRRALCASVFPTFYTVLTMPARSWGLSRKVWRRGGRALKLLIKRALRQFGRIGYCAVWEQNGRRFHLNIVFQGRDLTLEGLRAFLRDSAVSVGFGAVRHVSAVRSKQGLISYLNKPSQLPMSAPEGFHRLRSARAFLPARHDRRVPKARPRGLENQH